MRFRLRLDLGLELPARSLFGIGVGAVGGVFHQCPMRAKGNLDLERAAAMRGQSLAGFIEWLVGRALAQAGLVE